jgi:tetratricopeptide (TPR) repeat protein
LKRAEALAPHKTDITYELVGVYERLDKPEEAKRYERQLQELRGQTMQLDALLKQIGREPDNVSPRYEAGVLCLRLGREKEAGRLFVSALQLDPDHAPTHEALAEYYQNRGEVQRAEYHRRKAER